jgi:hypothetical protein
VYIQLILFALPEKQKHPLKIETSLSVELSPKGEEEKQCDSF